MIHPLANSGGARHLPMFVAEDVLVEDFPDPKDGEQPPSSPLLATLELSRRRGLTREAIERALLTHGTRVLEKEFGLDRSEEHTSELQSRPHLVCRLLLENKNNSVVARVASGSI